MWYAVESAFVDGIHHKSRLMFDPNVDEEHPKFYPGTSLCRHDEEPDNCCQTFMDGTIEIHVDWFQTKDQAITFMNGDTTYAIHRTFYYSKKNRTLMSDFLKWESVSVPGRYAPWKGVVIQHYRDGLETLRDELMNELHDARNEKDVDMFYGYLKQIGLDINAVDELYDKMFP